MNTLLGSALNTTAPDRQGLFAHGYAMPSLLRRRPVWPLFVLVPRGLT